jgi:putative hydrolase of the HAD superfamily
VIRAVLWDFGGVVLTSPFEAFARYERERGLPDGLIRRLNATNPDDNAWARLERGDVDLNGFAELFETEAKEAGHEVDALGVLELLSGDVRPQMVTALRRIKAEGLLLGMLTNNFAPMGEGGDARAARPEVAEIIELFDAVVESSKVGVRKPDPRFYGIACDELGIRPPEAVFLDDLGVNLKPARAIGMTTIKVVDPDEALAELERVLGFPLK